MSEARRGWMRAAGRGGAVAALALAAGLVLVGASPARAGENHFERGFEGELGRIAAHEAVYLGKHVLGHVFGGPYYGGPHYGPGYRYERRVYRARHRHYGPPYGRAVGHRRHHRHGHGPCGYSEHYEEYWSGPYRGRPYGYYDYDDDYDD